MRIKFSTSDETGNRPEVTECDWSVGCLDQWAYTHIILKFFVRVISLLLWSCQLTGKKKFEHWLKKSATVNIFSTNGNRRNCSNKMIWIQGPYEVRSILLSVLMNQSCTISQRKEFHDRQWSILLRSIWYDVMTPTPGYILV